MNICSSSAVTAFIALLVFGDQPAYATEYKAVVSADNHQAAAVGADMLERGGDAVDAAVATALALGVVHAFGSGIGGGGFAVVTRRSGERVAYDFREVAPFAAAESMFAGHLEKVNPEASVRGPLAIAVPGELAGLYALHQAYGKLSWSTVVMPSVKLARDGFVVTEIMHSKLKEALFYLRSSALGAYLVDENEAARKPGMQMRLPPLANTLEQIARGGIDTFYNGPVAAEIVRSIRAEGGILTLKDLADYRVKIREPLTAKFMGYEIITMPPPSSGGVVLLQTLSVLEAIGVRATFTMGRLIYID